MNPIVIIPSRMASTRLPEKPLADIAGKPMIVHVWERAVKAEIGPVYVACAEQAIADSIKRAGGFAILTDPNHPSGTDRIFEAYKKIKSADKFDTIVNLQGDLPTISPESIKEILKPLANEQVDISTLVAKLQDSSEFANPNVVKCQAKFSGGKKVAIAENFVRKPSGSDANFYHHIGIYGYRKKALEQFVKLPQSNGEKTEKLEQLRAMDNGMTIGVALVDAVPFGVDTKEDLDKARRMITQGK